MAGGLTARQIGQLLKEHGSYHAAIEARPELADDLSAAERLNEQLGKQFREVADAIATKFESSRLPRQLLGAPPRSHLPDGIAKARFERDVRAYETALERHARRQVKEAAHRGKRRREYTTQEFPRAMFVKAIRLLGEGAPITSRQKRVGIDEQTGLDRHLVSKIRDFTLGRGYQARPGQSSDTVVLVKVSKKAS